MHWLAGSSHLLLRLMVAIALAPAISGSAAAFQRRSPEADPAEFDLDLPDDPGPLTVDAESRLLVRVDRSKPVVAKSCFRAGNRSVVMLPDGRLFALPTSEAAPTDRPFVAATKDEIAERLAVRGFSRFKTKETKRFLYVYDTSDTFYTGTSRILETMYPALVAYFQRQKIAVHEPEVPLVVIMFRTDSEFQAFHEVPQGVVAYYHPIPNYVVMYELSRLSAASVSLAQKQAVATVAHEGVHQILFNIGVQQRLSRWPMWIAEGLPEYFSATDLGTNLRWKGVGTVNDLRMRELQSYARATVRTVKPGETVRATVMARNLTSTGYASAWALCHFLAQRRKEPWYAYLKDVTAIGPTESLSPETSEALFIKHFGDDYAELEEAMVKHLRSLPYIDPLANLRPAGR